MSERTSGFSLLVIFNFHLEVTGTANFTQPANWHENRRKNLFKSIPIYISQPKYQRNIEQQCANFGPALT